LSAKSALSIGAGLSGAFAGNIAPLVMWLCSPALAHASGQIFESQGGRISDSRTLAFPAALWPMYLCGRNVFHS
jgi:hypothetical protein